MDDPAKQANGNMSASVKFAMAMAIIQSRRLQKLPSSTTTQASKSDAIKWKRKAKERKEEIRKLKEDLKIAEDGVHHDLFPENVYCKCYFYDNLGQPGPDNKSDKDRINDVLRHRFLRQVRLSERKKRRSNNSLAQAYISDGAVENEMEQLRASIDFLVELCETSSPNRVEESSFKNLSHQAVDLILATTKALSLGGKMEETIESIVNNLIVRLVQSMCDRSNGDELVQNDNVMQFNVQHMMRKLGSDPYVGQRVILLVSQRISHTAENLLFMDPFDGAFPKMHNSVYTMIQLIEFLISDYLMSWSTRQDFDSKLLEDWVVSVFHSRKALELLESRNALYILYMDRLIGNLTRHLGQVPFVHMLQPDTLDKLFR